jgi:hypothetical protein
MGAAVALVVLIQACAVVLSFTLPKDRRVSRCYVPSLAIAWVGYVAYELIYPYLALLTVSAIAYVARRSVQIEQ